MERTSASIPKCKLRTFYIALATTLTVNLSQNRQKSLISCRLVENNNYLRFLSKKISVTTHLKNNGFKDQFMDGLNREWLLFIEVGRLN